MSYCRWSSDDFQCDIYLYEDVDGGWTLHTAGNRPVWPEGLLPPPAPDNDIHAWMVRNSKVMDLLENIPRVKINGPHDSKTFRCGTIGKVRELLLDLRANGYRFPNYVLETVQDEIRKHGENWSANEDKGDE
jgi:hypothetical protein